MIKAGQNCEAFWPLFQYMLLQHCCTQIFDAVCLQIRAVPHTLHTSPCILVRFCSTQSTMQVCTSLTLSCTSTYQFKITTYGSSKFHRQCLWVRMENYSMGQMKLWLWKAEWRLLETWQRAVGDGISHTQATVKLTYGHTIPAVEVLKSAWNILHSLWPTLIIPCVKKPITGRKCYCFSLSFICVLRFLNENLKKVQYLPFRWY